MKMATCFSFLAYVCSVMITSAILGEGEGSSKTHYLLYSVNRGEGFNLRRDVYMRAAVLSKDLRTETGQDWVLVLPPWPRLYHWKSKGFPQDAVKWERFFDVQNLNEYVPVLEFEEYVEQEGRKIEEVLSLQLKMGELKESVETIPCPDSTLYVKSSDGVWHGRVFNLQDMLIRSHRCVAVIGFTSTLKPELKGKRSVLVERFETVMHTSFGKDEYWLSRSSMVYAEHLREAGNRFMRSSLNYDPGPGNGRQRPWGTRGYVPADSTGELGGGFLSVHLRRADYLYARPDDVPSLEGAAQQINTLKQLHQLEMVFLATDAPLHEKEALRRLVEGVVWYTPTATDLKDYGDGGVAIIDQWIAAHARFFIGSFESTFSFRIREDRQLMGFSRETTYNHLCGKKDNETDHTSCATPTYREVPRAVIEKLHNTRDRRTEL